MIKECVMEEEEYFDMSLWFHLTREEQQEHIKNVLESTKDHPLIDFINMKKVLEGHLLEMEDYEMMDLLTRLEKEITDGMRMQTKKDK